MKNISQTNNINTSVTQGTCESSHTTYCEICRWNGYPYEKVIFELQGLRSEIEDGFIIKFTTYDYKSAGEKRAKHIHKHNQKLINELVKFALKGAKV